MATRPETQVRRTCAAEREEEGRWRGAGSNDRADRFVVNGDDLLLSAPDGTVLHPPDARERWPHLFGEEPPTDATGDRAAEREEER